MTDAIACERYREQISAMLDDELSAEEQINLQKHIESCASCREYLEMMRFLIDSTKEALVEAKDEIHRLRTEADKEIKDRRAEVQRSEHRLQQKEESLEKKADNLDKKEEVMQEKIQAADARLAEAFGQKEGFCRSNALGLRQAGYGHRRERDRHGAAR